MHPSKAFTAGEVHDVDAISFFSIDSPSPFDRFGQSIAVAPAAQGGQLLLVGAPYHRPNASCAAPCPIAGRVYGYRVWATSSSKIGAELLFTLEGEEVGKAPLPDQTALLSLPYR